MGADAFGAFGPDSLAVAAFCGVGVCVCVFVYNNNDFYFIRRSTTPSQQDQEFPLGCRTRALAS